MLRILIAFLVLVGVQLLGLWLVQLLSIPVPGVLLGIGLMLILLLFFGRLPAALVRTSNFLLAHLMLLFIPSVVAIMTQAEIIAAEWLPFVAACILATAVTMFATAATFQYMLKRQSVKQHSLDKGKHV
ncbi:MAG TPA: CidA/LrgA family protein [Paenalcaligenes sp.]|nr:CidA/LrgA family protein [Paenalcaligenes sp.]